MFTLQAKRDQLAIVNKVSRMTPTQAQKYLQLIKDNPTEKMVLDFPDQWTVESHVHLWQDYNNCGMWQYVNTEGGIIRDKLYYPVIILTGESLSFLMGCLSIKALEGSH